MEEEIIKEIVNDETMHCATCNVTLDNESVWKDNSLVYSQQRNILKCSKTCQLQPGSIFGPIHVFSTYKRVRNYEMHALS